MKKGTKVLLGPPVQGDSILIRMNDGRELSAEVLQVFNTVAGIKIKAQFGQVLLNAIDPGQVLKILSKKADQ